MLRLFDRHAVEALAVGDLLRLAGCSLDAGYTERRSSSSMPIEDGYLRCLRLRRRGPRPGIELVDPVAAIEAFLRDEKTRFEHEGMERHLRRIYGDLAPDRRARAPPPLSRCRCPGPCLDRAWSTIFRQEGSSRSRSG